MCGASPHTPLFKQLPLYNESKRSGAVVWRGETRQFLPFWAAMPPKKGEKRFFGNSAKVTLSVRRDEPRSAGFQPALGVGPLPAGSRMLLRFHARAFHYRRTGVARSCPATGSAGFMVFKQIMR